MCYLGHFPVLPGVNPAELPGVKTAEILKPAIMTSGSITQTNSYQPSAASPCPQSKREGMKDELRSCTANIIVLQLP